MPDSVGAEFPQMMQLANVEGVSSLYTAPPRKPLLLPTMVQLMNWGVPAGPEPSPVPMQMAPPSVA